MVGGLAGQSLSILVFSLLALDFWRRRRANRRDKESESPGRQPVAYIGETFHPAIKRCAYGKRLSTQPALGQQVYSFPAVIGIASACMLVRSAYRVAELSKGFNGPMAQKEIPFFLLDSLPVSLAAIALTVLPPHPDLWYAHKELARRT